MKKKNYLAIPVSTVLLFSSIYASTVQASSITGTASAASSQVTSGKNLRKSQMKEVPKASSKVLNKKAESAIEKKLNEKLSNKKSEIKRNYESGELIVKYKKQVTSGEISTFQKKYSLKPSKKLKSLNAELVKIPAGESVSNYISKLKKDQNVESVQPNYKYFASDFNNAVNFYDQLWGVNNTGQTVNSSKGLADIDVDAPESWTKFGSKLSEVVVGVIDTGVDINHPDLAGKIWTNTKEIPNNKIDDDKNGYVDDVNGWDFYNDDNTVYDALDGDEHGTHVSGTIAGALEGTSTSTNKGVVGVAPNVKILPLKFLGPFGGSTSDAIDAIEYAKSMGVKITNNSWGGGEYDPLLKDAIENSQSLFVAAAGNEGMNIDEEGASFPAGYDSANILSVAAVDNKGNLAPFSNYGSYNVDVAAPGVDILSSVPKFPINEITKALNIKQAGASAQISGDNYKAIFDGIGYEKISEAQRQGAFDKALNYLDLTDTSKKILLVQDDESDLAEMFKDIPELSSVFKNYLPTYQQLLSKYSSVKTVTINSESSISDYVSSNDLSSYDAVVWFTGNGLGFMSEEMTALTKTDADMLNTYLTGGGKLLLSGVNVISGHEKSTLVKDTLHLNLYSDIGPSLNVEGLAGGIYENSKLDVNRFDFPYYFTDYVQSNDPKTIVNAKYVSEYTQAYDYYSGTSMATPHTTGTAAILLGLNPNMSPEMLKLYTSAKGKKLNNLNGLVGTSNLVKSSNLDNFDDNETPGVPLDKSVLSGNLEATTDKNDVYAVSLKEGQGITFSLNGQAGSDFDLYVYDESAASVNNKNGMVAYSENENTSNEAINFIAPSTGIYYVNVYDYKGSGQYKLYSGNFGGTYEDDSNSVTFNGDGWMQIPLDDLSEETAAVINTPGDIAFTFVGYSFEWQGYKDPSQGIADVYVDGKKVASPSLYSSTFKTKQSLFKYDFPTYGTHSIKIVWTGKSDPAARKSATSINMDRFIVKSNPITLKSHFDTAKKLPVITWSATSWAESYSIYRKESSQTDYVQLNKTPITTASFNDTTALPGKTYDYVVVINTKDKSETPYSPSIRYVYDDDTKASLPMTGTAKGTLNTDAKDLNDVWSKTLEKDKTYEITLTGPSNANFDLSLFNIGSSTIYGQTALKKSAGTTSSEKIVFKPTKTGKYYIVPTAVKGSGQYAISLTVQTKKTVENSDSSIKYTGTWSTTKYASASGGSISQTTKSTGSLQYTFTGTGITVYALKDKNMGKADYYLDGKKIVQRDLYSSSRKYKVQVFNMQNLPNKAHTLKIVATGTKSSAATNKLINVDSFILTQYSSVK